MEKFSSKKWIKKMKNSLKALPSMGIAFVVLGVIILTASFVLGIASNFALLAGLFLIVTGCGGFIYSLKGNNLK